MDTTLKQRIVGIVVLIGLLGFCLTVLLHNTKSTQPHIAKINTHPDLIQNVLAPTPVAVVNATPAKPAVTTEINKPQPVADVTIPPAPVKTTTTPNPTKQPASMTVMPAPGSVTPTSSTITDKKSVMPFSSEHKVSENKVEDKFKTKVVTTTSKVSKIPEISQPKTTDTVVQAPAELTTKTSPGVSTMHQVTQTQPKTENSAMLPAAASSPLTHHHKRHEAVSITQSPTSMPSSHKAAPASALDNQKDLMVQVGTFSIAGNAKTLVDKLHANGFTAEAQKMKTSKGEMTRVIVGKKSLNHTQAEELRRELEKSMNLQGYIISHAKD